MVKYMKRPDQYDLDGFIEFLKKDSLLLDYLKYGEIEKFFKRLELYAAPYGTSGIIQILYESGIDVLNYLDYIPEGAFYARKIEDVFIVPDHIKSIIDQAFQNSSLTKLVLSKNSQLESIGGLAFTKSNLSGEVYLPDSLKSLFLSAFYNTKVTAINLPSSCVIKDYSDMRGRIEFKIVTRV